MTIEDIDKMINKMIDKIRVENPEYEVDKKIEMLRDEKYRDQVMDKMIDKIRRDYPDYDVDKRLEELRNDEYRTQVLDKMVEDAIKLNEKYYISYT